MLVAVMFVFPFVAKADNFALVALSKPGKVTLTAQAAGFAPKGGSIDAPPGSDITLNWTVPADWKGCYSNWQTAMIGVADPKTITAKIPNTTEFSGGRTFILSCFGLGQGQTVAVKVNIVKPDLAIARFSARGKTPVVERKGVAKQNYVAEVRSADGKTVVKPAIPAADAIPPIPKNTFLAGDGAITFNAAVQNVGKTSVPADAGILVDYQWSTKNSTKDADWSSMLLPNTPLKGLSTSAAISPGSVPEVASYVHTVGPSDPPNKPQGPFYFRVKADVGGAGGSGTVDEANEKNNTSRPIGPIFFIKQAPTP